MLPIGIEARPSHERGLSLAMVEVPVWWHAFNIRHPFRTFGTYERLDNSVVKLMRATKLESTH